MIHDELRTSLWDPASNVFLGRQYRPQIFGDAITTPIAQAFARHERKAMKLVAEVRADILSRVSAHEASMINSGRVSRMAIETIDPARKFVALDAFARATAFASFGKDAEISFIGNKGARVGTPEQQLVGPDFSGQCLVIADLESKRSEITIALDNSPAPDESCFADTLARMELDENLGETLTTTVHEVGHAPYFALSIMFPSEAKQIKRDVRDWVFAHMNIAKPKRSDWNAFVAGQLRKYSTETFHELVADSFTAVVMMERPPELAIYVTERVLTTALATGIIESFGQIDPKLGPSGMGFPITAAPCKDWLIVKPAIDAEELYVPNLPRLEISLTP